LPRFYRCLVALVLILSISRPSYALEIFEFDFPRIFPAEREMMVDAEELEPFLDEFFAREMERLQIPGATFSLVEGQELVFSKGYGFANLEKETVVDPAQTLFRVASLSKLFTATAAMQLYEQGCLDLDEDVNTYLDDFQLAKTFAAPVTMAHLLTHTGGFDDRSVSLAFRREEDVPSLETYLARNMPPRVRPPGEVISYSNHGSGLAGLVVEKISGQPFVDYVHENILEPLEMDRSSFLLPSHLAPDLATGYSLSGGVNRPRSFDFLYNIAPAASLNATAEDMANFMVAHLQGGQFGGERILEEDTLAKMHQQQFAHHNDLEGVTYGFFERFRHDRRFLIHTGLWGGFASLLFLYPEGELGFFVSLNSGAGREVHRNLLEEFVNQFLPAEDCEAALALSQNFASQVHACIGQYRPVRYSRHTLEKIAVLNTQCSTTDLGDGAIALEFSPQSGQEALEWTEASPFFFRSADGQESLAFRQEPQGEVTHLFLGTVAMERLAWFENAALHRALGIAFLALFSSAWLGWPLYCLYYRRRSQRGKGPWLFGWPAAVAAFLNTFFLVSFYYYITAWPDPFIYGVPLGIMALLLLPLLAGTLTLSSLWILGRTWRKGQGSLGARLHYSLVVLSLVLFLPFLHYWNLLGFRF
jgi:CubicO group peptidase (beta-lactamase class C family)